MICGVLPRQRSHSITSSLNLINNPSLYYILIFTRYLLISSPQVVAYLLSIGASINHRNKAGWTALIAAAATGQVVIITTPLYYSISFDWPSQI